MTDETDLTEDEFAAWVRAPDALKLLKDVSWDGRIRALSTRIKAGLLRTAAETARFTNGTQHRLFELVPGTWMHWSPEVDDHFWETGDTDVPCDRGDGYDLLHVGPQLFGVRLDPEGLKRMGVAATSALPNQHPTAPSEPSAPQATRHAGGRPAKTHWEPLLIEMCRQLYVGDLKPDRQSDIEKAMHDWLAAQGYSAGETQVRERARPLFQALQTEVGN